MRKHDKTSRLGAMFLALAMVITMCLPGMAMAAEEESKIPTEEDTGKVEITNINGKNAQVQLYKIVEAEYGKNGGLIKYQLVKGARDTLKDFSIEKPTTDNINKAAQNLGKLETIDEKGSFEGTTFSQDKLGAGAYIAIITSDDYVYNPMYLAVGYDEKNKLKVGSLDLNENGKYYLYGDTGVAKANEPKVEKEITGGTTEDTKGNDEKIKTAGVGDVVKYKVTPTIPTYPKNATNKTFFISDEMGKGLDFIPSVKVTVGENSVTVEAGDDDTDVKIEDTTVATLKKTKNGFNLNFDYDQVIDEVGSVSPITVQYSARINEKAVVGEEGNKNDVKLYYANDPNKGSTHTTTEEPEEANGIKKTEDEEIVYTYQIAFHKIGEGDDAKALAGAIFGVYTDEKCTNKIDQIVTNKDGYAVSNRVAAGTYYVKEIQAPAGYTLNTKATPIKATWTTVTAKATTTVNVEAYTTNIDDAKDGKQVGWIKDGKFYAMDESSEGKGFSKAYIKSEASTTTTTTVTEENKEGNGTAILKSDIPNTKTSELPSTGGMGTYIFTILGVAVIAIAGGLYMKKKNN